MTDALVSAVVSTILGNINSLWLEELGITGGLKIELERLQSTLSTIQAVLMDAEEKQWKSEAIKNWLGKLKHAAYEVDDILDDFAASKQRESQVSALFRLPKQLVFRSKMAHKLKDIRKKLDAIAEERSKFHLREGLVPAEEREVSDGEWRKTSSLVNELEVFGRDREREEIIKMVLNDKVDREGVSIYTVCGMGGLGKTTLAQLIYNNESIIKAFDLRIWVCVSDDFNITKLTKAIIESIGESCSAQELDPLQRYLQEKLIGKTFLLVLDDVWNEDQEKWERLKEAFRCGGKGSVVVVTTRIEKAALMMTTTPIHHLGCLSYDDSWTLFKHHAFRMGRSGDYPHLEALGREIVNKCGGVPLAIKALGGLMRFKERETEWISIKESMVWELEDEGNKILEVLRLSYRHLKPHLRQCFSFCSVFPKDFVMNKEKLIQLWMANGFLPSKGRMHLHDIGSETFNELVQRSFFQELDINGYGTCKMHDLIHDLAQSIMKNECCAIEPSQLVPKTIRHMYVFRTSSETSISNVDNLLNVSSLRTLLMVEDDLYLRIGDKQKHLRALEFANLRMEISVANLRNLRYLNLSQFKGKTLPESICNLHNLQTLKLRYCPNIQKLPKGMNCLKNLIYLDIRGCDALNCMPVGLGQLTCLRVLSKFIVGKNSGCYIEELKGLALEGELHIIELHNVKCFIDARGANLQMKSNLRLLNLSWRKNNSSNLQANDEEVLNGLQPHSNLKELMISNYQGPKFSNWLMDLPRLLPNLVEISLQYCDKCECLPPLGKLQFLKHLTISGMNALKCIDGSFYGDGDNVSSFPSLVELCFSYMLSLEVWEMVNNGSENFPLLCNLEIIGCPNLVVELPMLPSLKSLVIGGVRVSSLGRSVMHLTSLTSVYIYDFQEWTVLPDGLLQHHKLLEDLKIARTNLKSLPNLPNNPSALKHLDLDGCTELESLTGLEKLSSLETLSLCSCDSLVSLPENGLHGLSSLSSLRIQNCSKLGSLSNGLGYLTSLRNLLINGCPELNSLPDSIQHLSALRYLRICNCEGLTSLPNDIENLALLSGLDIQLCSNLMRLPQGMSSLTSLKYLRIIECPHLERRCKRDTGEDWPIIAHIPNITIESRHVLFGPHRSGGSLLKRVGHCLSDFNNFFRS